jgi:O-antigen ligase
LQRPLADTVPNAPFAFVAIAVALVTIAYTMPITESWKNSTYVDFQSVDVIDQSAREGSLTRQIAVGSLGLFGLAALAWPGGKVRRFDGILGVLCVTYVAWCAASCLWADDFSASFRRLIALACEVTAALAIAMRCSPRQFVWIVFACTLSWVGLGILAELSLATFRPWAPGYRFAGIFHPNGMGVTCVLLTMSSLYLGRGARTGRYGFYGVALVAFTLLLLTGSRTALTGMLLSYAAYWLLVAPASRLQARAVIISVAAGVLLFAIGTGMLRFSTDALAMGRVDHDPSSLTGRVPLWQDLLEHDVPRHPLVGHGYGSFWTIERMDEVSKSQGWRVPTAHSSYLDLVLTVGSIGAALCLSAMFLGLLHATRLEVLGAGAGYGFITLIILYGLAGGMLETTIGLSSRLPFFGICGMCLLVLRDDRHLRQASLRSNLPEKNISIPRVVPRPSA